MKFHQVHLLPLLCLPSSKAWGTLGHTTVAYIASSLVSPPTTLFFQSILYNDTEHYLANIATWADSFRYTAAGRFSAPLHFIDARDDPPRSCGVQMKRDCGGSEGEGCIVGAIANYTGQLLDPNIPFWKRNMAAKFVVHFLGDIHQPLHTEALLRGGNSIPVLFGGKATNLHHVWDTSIPETHIGGYGHPFAQLWAANLTDSILHGVYRSQAENEWLEGMDLQDPESSALIWAGESNAAVCSTVLPQGQGGVEDVELSGKYFEDAVPVVESLIARAGLRLAKWLDLIALAAVRDEL
ncbi:phospholipase C/P1 nuclease domain-containing protein [Amylocarpus encephaloides]|uniref:Phospholipase C/P1 nuclease domain-containing protein n=1 Tax=Amylocarpus encephaloides TaxID=45428 RepID=A0A9P7YR20_9HELO|nr:phospholipase C/P1 nuclease domain-containing protein [Amylocarpus encephaloides]